MVPRTEMIALDVNASVERLNNVFIETGHSKIVIFKDSIDDVIGFVHSNEMFNQPKDIASLVLPVGFVPESMTAQRALNHFIQLRKSVLIVVDEFGGTSGMITIEDVLEEILGDIEDEHDNYDLVEEQLTDYEYHFSGRLDVDYLNERYSLNIPISDSYETLAGYIYTKTESIPEEGETIVIDNLSILIEKVGETRIELVKLVVHQLETRN